MNKIRKLAKKLPYPIKIIIKAFLFPKYYLRYFLNDFLAFFGHEFGKSNIIFVAGYPKSGTTWVENFIGNIPGYNPRILYGDLESIRQHNLPCNAFKYFPKHGYSSVKTHINPADANIEILRDKGIDKVVVMYRDPRDIVVSNYYHVLASNPWKTTDPFYLDYEKVSKEEGMMHSLDMVAEDFTKWILGWKKVCLETGNFKCYFLKYEDLLQDSELHFKKILDLHGINLSAQNFQKVISKITPKNKGFFPDKGNVGNKSTLRKGAPGAWKNDMGDKVKLASEEKLNFILKHIES